VTLPTEPSEPIDDPELERLLEETEFTTARRGEEYIVRFWSPVHAELYERVHQHIRSDGWARLWWDGRRYDSVIIGSRFYWTIHPVLNRQPLPLPEVRPSG
jgi:hypothetical protein